MSAPEPLQLLERPAIDGAQYLPLNLVRPWVYNPRKRFTQAKLDEMADSIEKFGVMQPVLVRPIVGAKRGGALYEVVAGERRYRGSTIVAKRRKQEDIAVIPAIVRDLSDFDALELATTENLHREDLHPLEEAEGFEGLLLHPIGGGEFSPPRVRGYTVDDLAARIGKTRGYVFAKLKLLALIPAARDAFYADKISNSVALLIARMPASVQVEATKKVLQGWAGDPYPFRQAQELLQREFMLKLSSAPFKITDESLVPGAGNCNECPKRTGAAPDLFDDVKSSDVCTDPACFASKKDAHQARILAQAKAEGREVITGAAAKKVKPERHSSTLKGYIQLDKTMYELPGTKTMAQHLGKDAPAIALLEDPHTHELVKVVRADDAMQVLRDKGVIKGNKLSRRSDAERKAEQKQKAEVAWRNELAQRSVVASIDPQYDDADMHSWLLPELASAMWTRLDHETTKRASKLLGLTVSVDVDTYFRGLDARHLDQAFVAMAVAGQLYVNPHSSSKPTRLLAIAGRLGIDGARVRAELEAAAKVKIKVSAVKNPPAKKVASKSPTARYRNAQTGETWSGRGLKPKWLAIALTAGKTLADFDTERRDPEFQEATANSRKGVQKSKKTEPSPAPSTSEDKKPAAAKAAGKTKTKQMDKTPARAGVPVVITPAGAWPFPTGPKPTTEAQETTQP